jgi:hypothetical protein
MQELATHVTTQHLNLWLLGNTYKAQLAFQIWMFKHWHQ